MEEEILEFQGKQLRYYSKRSRVWVNTEDFLAITGMSHIELEDGEAQRIEYDSAIAYANSRNPQLADLMSQELGPLTLFSSADSM
jgi:hypothetical protein